MNNQENEVITEEKLNHEIVREAFFKMQKSSGAAIKPFGLLPLFCRLLKAFKPNKMNRLQARNIADVFSALQNEYFVINHNGKNNEWFYMTTKRWQKYGLGKKAIYNSINFLHFCCIIDTEIRQHPLKEQNKVRYYKFNLDMVKTLMEEVNSSGKIKKN